MDQENAEKIEIRKLYRSEMEVLHRLLMLDSIAELSLKEIPDRLNMIPGGIERLRAVCKDLADAVIDVLRTVPDYQKMKIKNTFKDYEMRMLPKLMPTSTNVIFTKEDAMTVIDAVQAQHCTECMTETDQCEYCRTYQLLCRNVPLNDYNEDGFLCPYSRAEWSDK